MRIPPAALEKLNGLDAGLRRELKDFNEAHEAALKQLSNPGGQTALRSPNGKVPNATPPRPPRTSARPIFSGEDLPLSLGRLVYPSTLPKDEFESRHEPLGSLSGGLLKDS